MSCCGNKRAAYAQQQSARSQPSTNNPGSAAGNAQRNSSTVPSKMWADLRFEYTGDTSLSIIGFVTGRRYRWISKGDAQEIDYRDAGGLRPHLHSLKRLK